MTTNDPVGTVQRMFAAFRVRDLDALLDTVDADTRWTYIGANPRVTKADLAGKAGVGRFFEGIWRRLEVATFEAHEFVLQGKTVVVFGGESGTVRATGEAFRNEWCQKYVVDANQITRMVEYNIQVEPR
jgi:ketosteroid isomerase-like protein